jgi:hypothetical protein
MMSEHNTRRGVIKTTAALTYGALTSQSLLFSVNLNAQGVLQAELAWGGLGFSVPNSEVQSRFPETVLAINHIGGLSVLVNKLIDSINKAYLSGGGSVKDIFKALDAGESLIFCVAFDYEQIVQTPSVGEAGLSDVESFLYCQAQVIYVDPPVGLGSGGDFRVLYSFPFRVQYNFRNPVNNSQKLTEEFSKNFYSNQNSILNVFEKMIAGKRFSEKRFPKALRVNKIIFTDEFNKTLDFVKIKDRFKADFIGNVLSTSLAEVGGLSVIPFQSNQLIGSTLASRFKRDDKILQLASNMGGDDQLDYSLQIEMHRMVRRISGENQANVRIARGMSTYLTLRSENRNQELAKIKISLVTDIVIDRLSFTNNLEAFDLRYIIQMIILMFDDFVSLVVRSDDTKYEKLGLKKSEHQKDVAIFKKAFEECIY